LMVPKVLRDYDRDGRGRFAPREIRIRELL
jgi:hypothetical protein